MNDEPSQEDTIDIMVRFPSVPRPVVALIVFLAVLVAGTGRVEAHASLIASDPSYGATLTSAPLTATFRFDNRIEPGLMKVKLKDADGVEIGKGVYAGANLAATDELVFDLPVHGEGSWQLTWTSFAFDGHVVSGVIPYNVSAADGGDDGAGSGTTPDTPGSTDTGGTAPAQTGGGGTIVEVQLRLLSYLALSVLVGGLLLVALASPRRAGSTAVGLVADQANGVLLPAACVAAVVSLGRLSLAMWRLASADALDQVPRLLWEGTLLAWPACAALFIAAGVLARRHLAWSAAAAAGGILLSASEGHAAAANAPGFGTVLAGAHLLAACVWAGGVAVFAFAVTADSWAGIDGRWTQVRPLLDRLTITFIVAAATLAVTGVRSATVISDGIPSGRYGTVLAVKLAAGGCVVALGAWHAWLRRNGRALSRTTLLAEALLLVGVLAAGAVLAATGPL